jgi:tetratricopeptide (TPR) repeat protein
MPNAEQHLISPAARCLKSIAQPMIALFLLLPLAVQGTAPAANSEHFTVSESGGFISVAAVDAPLKSVIAAVRRQVEIDVDGEVAEEDRVTANFDQLPLEQAIAKLTDRYVFVHDETDGRLIRIVLFRQGEDAPPAPPAISSRALNARALDAWKHGDIHSAIDYFEAAVAQDPDDWRPRADYGRLLVMMTSYQNAAPHLERAAELSSDNPRVWLDLFSYYQRTLQFERAFAARERVVDLADGQAIVQDQTGLWRLERDSIYSGF